MDFKKLKEIFNQYLVVDKKQNQKEKNYLNLKISGIDVEFIGVSSIFDRKNYQIFKNKDYEIIKIQAQNINISSLINLIECYKSAYKRHEKEKHLKRIELIKNYLEYEKLSK